MGKTKETFEVGAAVISIDAEPFGGFNTKGFLGFVRKVDAKAGVCVSIFVSRIYEPCFWYSWYKLEMNPAAPAFKPVTAADIETALGGREKNVQDNPIIVGCLKSWLLDKARVVPGHSLEQVIQDMKWSPLKGIYNNTRDDLLAAWIKEYDTRPRRPRMTVESDEVYKGIISIRRPKMGGK